MEVQLGLVVQELVLVVEEHAYKVLLCWVDYQKFVANDLDQEKVGLVDH